MSVFAHTDKPGWYTQSFRDTYYYGSHVPSLSHLRVAYGGIPVRAASFKSVTAESDGILPTNYSRVVMRALSRASGKCKTSANWVEFPSGSLISNLFGFDAQGGGCDLPKGQVFVPEYMVLRTMDNAKTELNNQSGNILEDLAQASQTAGMLGEIFNILVDIVLITRGKPGKRIPRLFVNGKPVGRMKAIIRRITGLKGLRITVPAIGQTSRTASQAWLVYYYGIKPLVSTFNALAESYVGGTFRIKAMSRATDSPSVTEFVNTTPRDSYPTTVGRTERMARTVLHATYTATSNLLLWRSLGLSGEYNPLTQKTYPSDLDVIVTAWALVPYSFVFDWLIPVERWLRSLYWAPELTYSHGYTIKRVVGSGSCTATRFASNPITSGTRPRVDFFFSYFEREVHLNRPPSSKLVVNQSITPVNLVNALALLAAR